MGTLYVNTSQSGNASGSSNNSAADLTGTSATVSGSVVTLDGSPDLSGLATSGASQAAIWISQATNSNRKVFWVTAVDNTAKTVTVDVAPTGVTSSAWAIGGRVAAMDTITGCLRGGDEVRVGSDLSSASVLFTLRTSGTAASPIRIVGDKGGGAKPVLTASGTGTYNAINFNSATYYDFENFSISCAASGGWTITGFNTWNRIIDCILSGATGAGALTGSSGSIENTEIKNYTNGISLTGGNVQGQIVGCYIHDLAGWGVTIGSTTSNFVIAETIFDTIGGDAIVKNGAAGNWENRPTLIDNIFYNITGHGINFNDTDDNALLLHNVFFECGTGSSKYAITHPGASRITTRKNCFYTAGKGSNLNGFTAHASDISADPLFVDPAAGNFTLDAASPLLDVGFPWSIAALSATTFRRNIGPTDRASAGGSIIGGQQLHAIMEGLN